LTLSLWFQGEQFHIQADKDVGLYHPVKTAVPAGLVVNRWIDWLFWWGVQVADQCCVTSQVATVRHFQL